MTTKGKEEQIEEPFGDKPKEKPKDLKLIRRKVNGDQSRLGVIIILSFVYFCIFCKCTAFHLFSQDFFFKTHTGKKESEER